MTGEVEVALTEEFETMTAAPAGGQALADTEEVLAVAGLIAEELEEDASEHLSGAIRIQHAVRDRGHARELFVLLAQLPEGDAKRLRIRGELVELDAHHQMSEKDVMGGLESANAYSTVSLDAPDSGDEDAPAVAESLGMVDEALEGVEYRESLKPLLERLPPREKRILLLRFFGNMTQSQIATELGISQMHASRLLARTLTQLREGLTSED